MMGAGELFLKSHEYIFERKKKKALIGETSVFVRIPRNKIKHLFWFIFSLFTDRLYFTHACYIYGVLIHEFNKAIARFLNIHKLLLFYKLRTTITVDVISFLFNASLPKRLLPQNGMQEPHRKLQSSEQSCALFHFSPCSLTSSTFPRRFLWPQAITDYPRPLIPYLSVDTATGITSGQSLQHLHRSPTSFFKGRCQTVRDSPSTHLPSFPVRSHKQATSMLPAWQDLPPLPAK